MLDGKSFGIGDPLLEQICVQLRNSTRTSRTVNQWGCPRSVQERSLNK